jgi:NAD(P)H-dependent flavin oxidoreductase YrpB (nitropropane dioxygenase family)
MTWYVQYDYTNGVLPELTEVIIRSKAALFVCAIGVPPKDMVEKLHAAKIPVMKYVAVFKVRNIPGR